MTDKRSELNWGTHRGGSLSKYIFLRGVHRCKTWCHRVSATCGSLSPGAGWWESCFFIYPATIYLPSCLILHTSDFQYNSVLCHLQKYLDDTRRVGSINSYAMQGRGEVWTSESWVFCGRWRVTLLSWHWSGVRSTAEVPESHDLTVQALFALSNVYISLLME